MQRKAARFVLLFAALGLGACSAASRIPTGAAPLAPTDQELTTAKTGPDAKKEFLLNQITTSLTACENYKRTLLLGSRGSNLTFDILTTVFGALGTAFTHVDVVHGFTAATTISSGTKTAIDADIYQNATAPLMIQSIQDTYDAQMKSLLEDVEKTPAGQSPTVEFADIVRVHNECSLTEAMADLQKLLQKKD